MWLLYVLVALTLFPPLILNTKSKRGSATYLAIFFSVFAFLMMFKGSTVGNDTNTYLTLFDDIASYTDVRFYIKDSRYETGFIYFNRFISRFTDNAYAIFMVTGPFIAFSFAHFIYKYSKMPWMSTFMFLTLQFYDLSFSGLRQILSISILLFSYDFLIKRKLAPFILLVFVATSFHTSAIAFLLLYPFTFLKQTRGFYGVSAGITVVMSVFFSIIMRILEKIFPQYLKYFEEDGTSFKTSPTLACTLMIVLWLTLLVISELCKEESIFKTHNNVNKISGEVLLKTTTTDDVLRLSIWFGIIMLFLSLNGTILNRFKYVFTVPIIAYYPNAVMQIKNPKHKAFLLFGSCIVFLTYILIIYTYRPEWQSTYPYSFFWQEDNIL